MNVTILPHVLETFNAIIAKRKKYAFVLLQLYGTNGQLPLNEESIKNAVSSELRREEERIKAEGWNWRTHSITKYREKQILKICEYGAVTVIRYLPYFQRSVAGAYVVEDFGVQCSFDANIGATLRKGQEVKVG